MNYKNVSEHIPELIKSLAGLNTQYPYQNKYIGQAIAYLNLLKDILDREQQ